MKKLYTIPAHFLSVLLILLSLLSACKKVGPDTASPAESDNKTTVYKNQTGDPGAEALQVQMVNSKKKFTVNVYGTFDSDNNPIKARSLTFQKIGNDTTVHLQLNDFTNQLETSYLEVRGIKQPWVLKHSYVAGDPNVMRLNVYAYNWAMATGVLKYETLYRKVGATLTATPVFAANRGQAVTVSGVDLLVGVGVGLGVAESVFIGVYGAGAGLLSIPVATAVVAVTGVAVAVVAVAAAIALVTSSPAGAAEFDPRNEPYPPATPPKHVATLPNPATLPNSPCAGTSLTFKASMDAQGSILVSGITGSVGPYSYAVNSQSFQSGEVFANNYAAGTYFIYVRDGRGCISTQLITFTRPVPLTGSLIGKWSLTKTCNKSGQCGLDVPISLEFMANGKFEGREYKDGDLKKVTIGTYTIKDRILTLSWVENGASTSVSYGIVSITAQELVLFLDKTIVNNAEDLDLYFKR
jgi:hypothetical protein